MVVRSSNAGSGSGGPNGYPDRCERWRFIIGGERTYRLDRRFGAGSLIFWLLLTFGFAVMVLRPDLSDDLTTGLARLAVAVAPIALLATALLAVGEIVTMFRGVVKVGEAGVTNTMAYLPKRRFIPWGAVESVSNAGLPFGSNRQLVFHLRDGGRSRVSLAALADPEGFESDVRATLGSYRGQ